MAFRLIAFHYPKPEHRDELVQRVANAAEVLARSPGLLDVECWRDEASDAVVATAKFESKEACMQALAAAAAETDFAYDERESRPREVYHLVEPT